MVHRTLAALVLLAFAATPVLAQEDCAQALKDTTAKFKTNNIGPQAAGIVGDLITKAGPMCSGSAAQQAEGIELLRMGRIMIGE